MTEMRTFWESTDESDSSVNIEDQYRYSIGPDEIQKHPIYRYAPKLMNRPDRFDLAVRLQKGNIDRALQLFMGVSPDVAAKAQQIADARGIPVDTVIRNQKDWEQLHEGIKVVESLFQRDKDGNFKNPYTVAHLSNPQKMAIAKDDLEALKILEDAVRKRRQASEGFWKRRGRRWGYAALNILESAAELPGALASIPPPHLGLILSEAELQEYEEQTMPQKEQVVRWLQDNRFARFFEETAEAIRPAEIDEAPWAKLMAGDYSGFFKTLSAHAEVNAPYLIALGLTAWATSGTAALVAAGSLEAASTLKEGLAEGKSLPDARAGAALSGLAEGFFERYTLGSLKLIGKPLVDAVGKPAAKKTAKAMALRILGAGATEGASESATSVAQDFADWITGDKDAMEGASTRAINAALVGATLGGGIGTAGSVAGLAAQRARNREQKQALAELEAPAERSKLRQRAPEQFEEFADGVIKDNNLNTTFTVSLDALKTFYQKDPDGLDEVIEKLGLQDQIKDAEAAGTELKVAIGKWVAHAPELNLPDAFKDHIRFDDDGMTTNELKAAREQIGETINKLREQLAATTQAQALPSQASAIRDKLMLPKKKGGAGMKAADADANIAVMMAGARALSQRQGESAQQWFDRVNPVLAIGEAAPAPGIKGAVQFGDTQTIIHLFQTADRSTFLHETAHIFTQQMSDMVDAGVSDAQLKKDLDTLKTFAGKLDEAGHEKIAKAFETYLFEGKAPSIKLRDAFSRFKRWLTTIYKSVSGTGVALNDEIRGAFDRMLAAEADILEAQTYYALNKSIVDHVKPTKKEKASLDKKKQKATESAIDKQTAKYLKAFEKAYGGRRKIREQVKKEFEKEPVYVAAADAVGRGGLDAARIKNDYGQDMVSRLKALDPKLVTRKGRMTLEQLAITHEFDSPDVLLDALASTPRFNQAVTARTQQLLARAEDNIRADLQQSETIAGQEAIHSNASLEFLVAEANLLQKKLQQSQDATLKKLKKLEAAAYKDEAEAHIGGQTVAKAIRYLDHARNEKTQAQKAFAFAAKADLVNARKAKKNQIIHFSRMLAAMRARDEKKKIEARYKPQKIKSRLKSVENSYANAIIQIVVGHGLTQSKTLKMPEGDPLGELLKQDTNLAALIPGKLSNPPQGGWKNITMDELRELDASVKTLLADGSNELKALEDSQYKTVQDVVDASKENMAKLDDKKIHNEFSKKGAFIRIVDGVIAYGSMMQFIFDRLDFYQHAKTGTFGPLRKLFNLQRDAEGLHEALKQQVFEKSIPHLSVLSDAARRLHKVGGNKGFDIEGVPVTKEMKKMGRTRWTGERVVSVVLNMGNAGNLAALKNSYGYTQAQLDKIASLLTKQELEAIQGIWDNTDSLFPALDKVHFSMYNRHVEKVKAQPLEVVTKDGEAITLEGGYYPLVFDPLLSTQAGKQAEEDILKNETGAIFRTVKPADGFTHSRVEGHSRPPDLSLGVWYKHIHDTTRYITHAKALRDLNRVTANPEWAEMVKEKTGRRVFRKDPPQVYENIRSWVSYQARPQRRIGGVWGRFLEDARRKSTIAILGLNFWVGAKQRLSMFSAMRAIGAGPIVRTLLSIDPRTSLFGLSNTESWDQITQLSNYMKFRGRNIDREISDTLSQVKPMARRFKILGKEFTWRDVEDFSFSWIQMNDRAAVTVVWRAAFDKRLRQIADDTSLTDNQKMEQAVEYADSVVQDTQPSSLPIDLSALQRDEGMMRLFTSFMTWTLKWGNIMISHGQQLKAGAITPGQYARHLMYDMFMPLFALMLIGAVKEGELPEVEDYISEIVSMLLSPIPIARGIPYSFRYGKELGVSPAFEGGQRLIDTGKSAYQLIANDGEYSKLLWNLGRLGEYKAGVPVLNVVKDIKKQYENITED